MRKRQFLATVLPLACMLSAGSPAFAKIGGSDNNTGTTAGPALFSGASVKPTVIPVAKDTPVDLTADTVVRDENANTVTARGDVKMFQGGRALSADEVVYNQNDDTVTAYGKVILIDPNGDIHFADTVHLKNQMQDGDVKNMLTVNQGDGGRFSAETGERTASDPAKPVTTVMHNASYTACAPCRDHPDDPPPWKIDAREIIHDADAQKITYHDATFDLWNVPVFYTPYFENADGTVKQKSGFLTPDVAYKSRLGLEVTNSYYLALAPDYDATIGATIMGKQDPMLFGEYRERFANASLKLDGSVTYSKENVEQSDGSYLQDANNSVRGSLFGKGLLDINDNWRAGMNLQYASDDDYLRTYGFSHPDVLENQLYLEHFDNRDYAVAKVESFQDIRTLEDRTDQPNVLPEIQANFLGEPASMLGGRWSLNFSTLDLQRKEDGQDMQRAVAQAGWERRYVSGWGLVTTTDLDMRGDVYYVQNHDIAASNFGTSSDGAKTRGFAQGQTTVSYPLVKGVGSSQIVVEPIAALTLAPNINSKNTNFPDEDSQDVQLDAMNIFSPDRFPGLDRIEDASRVTYGVRNGLYTADGSKGEFFIGQSRRFNNNDNPFPEGSGLSDQSSDLVGQITLSYQKMFMIDYRALLDSNSFASHRHEVDALANFGKLQLSAQYFFADAIEGTTLTDSDQQLQGTATYALTDEWKVSTSAIEALGNDSGLRRATLGVGYYGQCFNVISTLERNLTQDDSDENSTQLMFRFGLKNLGEFATSGLNLDQSTAASSTTTSTTTTTKK